MIQHVIIQKKKKERKKERVGKNESKGRERGHSVLIG